jgi:hypothetical protein
MYIAPYDPGHRENHEPRRPRKLLAHRREIDKFGEMVQQKGFTIIPLRLYLIRGRAKLEIALAKGKKLYDKRQAIAERDAQRRITKATERHRQRDPVRGHIRGPVHPWINDLDRESKAIYAALIPPKLEQFGVDVRDRERITIICPQIRGPSKSASGAAAH